MRFLSDMLYPLDGAAVGALLKMRTARGRRGTCGQSLNHASKIRCPSLKALILESRAFLGRERSEHHDVERLGVARVKCELRRVIRNYALARVLKRLD